MNSRFLLLAATVLVVACGGPEGSPLTGLPLALHSPGPTTLLRLPARGGDAVAYRTRDLTPIGWKVQKVPPIRQYVGVDLDLGLLYAVDSSRGLVAVDLRAERARVLRKGVRSAALAPDGSLFSVDTGGAVTQVRGRRPVVIGDRLPANATALVGAANGRLLSLPTPRRSDLTVYEPSGPAANIALVAAQSTATLAGDLVAVAADSAVVLADPSGQREPRVVDVSGGARSVLFSPSGHRFYVAGRKDLLRVFDRYEATEVHDIKLPAPGRDVRGDLYGLWLLVRPESGDSVWVVDVAARRVVATAQTAWDDELPLIAPPSLLLVRRGKDVVGLELGSAGLREVGKVTGSGSDLWIPLAWSPPSDARATAAAVDTLLTGDSTATGQRFYLQVSSSRNPEWARELSNKINEAGINAAVMEPANPDDVYRVVVGPYATRDQADSAGRSLGMPSFVITAPGRAAR